MTASKLICTSVVLIGGLLAGCAAPPAPNSAAEIPYCHNTNKGRVIACTTAPVPSLDADAQAKQFAPDSNAFTVYVVRRNWADGRNFVKIRADSAAAIATLPNTMVRFKLKPGAHTITFDFEGQSKSIAVDGKAGDLRFVRVDGVVLFSKSTYQWASEPEAAIRERAIKARLLADVTVH
jgi:hypothetical protein